MAIEITIDARVVARSKNLRGILDYARKSQVWVSHWIMKKESDSRALVCVTYSDNAKSVFHFESFTVAQGWIRARRVWGLTLKTSRDDFEHWELI